jgi:hypothetical protein
LIPGRWRRASEKPPLAVANMARGSSGSTRGQSANRYRAYIKALEEQLDMVLAGDLTPAAGLAAAARAWEAFTDRLGRTSQRRHDRAAMGLATRTGTEGKP